MCIFATVSITQALQQDRQKSRVQRTLEKLSAAFSLQGERDRPLVVSSTSGSGGSIDHHHHHRMEQINNSNMSLSSLSGIAGRIPPSEDGGLSHLLADLGPACTRSAATFREVLAEVSGGGGGGGSATTSSLHESALAHLIFFFSQKTTDDLTTSAAAAANTTSAGSLGGAFGSGGLGGLSPALLGSLLPQGQVSTTASGGGTTATGGWNLKVVAQVLNEDYGHVDWHKVAQSWDFPGFMFRDTNQFRILLDLYRAGARSIPPLAALTRQWSNTAGQLSFLEAILAVPSAVYTVPLNDEEMADANTAPQGCQLPNPQCWASLHMLSRLLYLSDVPSLYRRVRDLFVKCLLQCPEVLLCSLVRMQLRVASAAAAASSSGGGASAVTSDVNIPLNAGLQLKQDVMRELIPLFFRHNAHHRVQNAASALRRLYAISPPTVNAACVEAWRSTANRNPEFRLQAIWHIINIGRLMPNPNEAISSMLSGKDVEFNLAMAFCLSDREIMQLKPWLAEKLSGGTPVAVNFAQALIAWLRKYYSSATSRAMALNMPNNDPHNPNKTPLVSIENLIISIQLLRDSDTALLTQAVQDGRTIGDAVSALVEAVLQCFPALRPTLVVPTPVSQQQQQQLQLQQQQQGGPSNTSSTIVASEDVEEMATQYFQKIYTSEQSIGEVVDMLKRFKTSGNAKENEIFACVSAIV
jgi:CCR4-NOT transcription complex subunit 1 TTP binding domain/CCR4-NOT transcription complex subunit 1 HEAT repeat